MKPLFWLALWPAGFVTTTVTAPATWAGVVALRLKVFETETFVAAVPPKVTVMPFMKLVPVIVTLVPPLVVPELGLTAMIVGGAM